MRKKERHSSHGWAEVGGWYVSGSWLGGFGCVCVVFLLVCPPACLHLSTRCRSVCFFCFGGCCVAGWVVSLGVCCWWCVSLCVPCWLPPLFFAVSPLVLHFLSACHSHFCCHLLLLGCPYSTMDLTAIPMEQLLAEFKRRQCAEAAMRRRDTSVTAQQQQATAQQEAQYASSVRHAASHDQQSPFMSAAADSRSASQGCKNADNFAHHSSPAANAPSSSQYRRQSA